MTAPANPESIFADNCASKRGKEEKGRKKGHGYKIGGKLHLFSHPREESSKVCDVWWKT